jgi:hypothetical protein
MSAWQLSSPQWRWPYGANRKRRKWRPWRGWRLAGSSLKWLAYFIRLALNAAGVIYGWYGQLGRHPLA